MRILWDFDGTLMDTYPVYAKLFREALGKPCSEREMFDLLKVTFGHAFKTLGLSRERVEHLRALERQLDPAQFRPFDGVEAVLAAAEINVIMTHKDRKNAHAILRACGLEKYFTEIVTADDGFPNKPDPASYRYLHEKYHLDLAVGDRELDILPARAIGIGTCLFQNHTPGADYYVDSYNDFFTVIGRKKDISKQEETKMPKTSLIATGDVFITRRLGTCGYDGFEEVAEIIRSHDVGFTNLEMTFHDAEGYPAAESGGTWAMMEPGALDDVQRYGFNIYNTANNHSGDYGTGGVLATIRHLKEREMVFSGTGANLAEASRPCYLDTKYARVALISVSASFHAAEAAGSQSPDLPGRPGLNPLGTVKKYHADPETFRTLEEIAYKLGIHSSQSASIKNGYTSPPPEGTFKFGAETFVMDTDNFQETKPNAKDLKRIVAEIEEAKKQADIVLVSLHAHAAKALCPQNIPAEFIEVFSRACVDAGADAILGHGPHELRGIEIYQGKPIFYSLGNFIFQTETVSTQPVDAYLAKGMPADTKVGAYMANRSANGTRGYGTQKPIWKAVMGAFTMEDGKVTGVTLYPVDLGMGMPSSKIGWPRMEKGNETLEYLAELSAAYGTAIRIENGVGYIDL